MRCRLHWLWLEKILQNKTQMEMQMQVQLQRQRQRTEMSKVGKVGKVGKVPYAGMHESASHGAS